jgi:hypothetical protein
MSIRTPNMRKLEQLRDALKAEIEAKTQQLAGVEMAIRHLHGEPANAVRGVSTRPNVKQLLLTMLEQVGDEGLNAATAVEMASRRGEKLERGTVSSLLSRFKADGLVRYTGTVYILVPSGKSAASEEEEASRVH